jgi:thiamine-phosphate pyrophosphorylase
VLYRARETAVTKTPPRPRLYLVTPALEDPKTFLPDLEAALGAGDVAAVLLRLADADERSLVNCAKAVAAAVHRRDIALLLDNRPDIVGRADADGAHVAGIEAFAAALASLKPDRIAGAGGLHSRHEAMLAGETGADYVMFGDPDRRGHRPPFEIIEERIVWWAELVEIPCIGYAAQADEVRPMARAGADFVALGDWIWTHPEGAAAAVASAAASLAEPVS